MKIWAVGRYVYTGGARGNFPLYLIVTFSTSNKSVFVVAIFFLMSLPPKIWFAPPDDLVWLRAWVEDSRPKMITARNA